MMEIIQFFIAPYHEVPVSNIVLEFIAAFFGIISVLFAKKENVLVYPTGLVSTCIYVYLLSQWNLYGDLIINIYYSIMSLYGWYVWTNVLDDSNNHITISKASFSDKIKALGIFIFTAGFIILVYRYYDMMDTSLGLGETISFVISNVSSGRMDDFRLIIPYLDTFTTGAAFVAMWYMANKKIDNWIFWIAVNFVSVPLYFIKGFGFTGIQYFVFLILAIFGYLEWKKKLKLS